MYTITTIMSDSNNIQEIHYPGKKQYKCKICNRGFTRGCSLKRHQVIHTGERAYKCEICNRDFTQAGCLKRHQVTHTGEKKYKCEICNSRFTVASSLKVHKRLHTGEKPHKCEICEIKFSTYGILKAHQVTHTGEKAYKCEICEYNCSRSSTLKRHMKTHTIEGQRYRKKQENRVYKLLKEWGFEADDEVTINVSNKNCLNDSHRHFSRLDYVISNCVNAMLILEVDEDQHTWYELSCEISRMSDVRASLMKAGYELPIYWIRYNPNGKYHIGGDHVHIHRPEREIALKSKLYELCSPDFKPDNQVNIHYMFYDLMSEELGPEIMVEPDFPEYLQDCVSWH